MRPVVPEQIDISVNRGTAKNTVRSQAGENEKEEVLAWQFDLPKDLYNGMLISMTKNLQKGVDETVSVLAFTPASQIVKVQLHAVDEQPVLIGDVSRKATQYVFIPQIGLMKESSARPSASFLLIFTTIVGFLSTRRQVLCNLKDRYNSCADLAHRTPESSLGLTVRSQEDVFQMTELQRIEAAICTN
jgi:hypothetical protein